MFGQKFFKWLAGKLGRSAGGGGGPSTSRPQNLGNSQGKREREEVDQTSNGDASTRFQEDERGNQ